MRVWGFRGLGVYGFGGLRLGGFGIYEFSNSGFMIRALCYTRRGIPFPEVPIRKLCSTPAGPGFPHGLLRVRLM